MKKSKEQIVIDTLAIYWESPKNTRAVETDGTCLYTDNKGNHCFVGWNLVEEVLYQDWDYNAEGITSKIASYFKPECEGHELEFWDSCQIIHDAERYWSKKGLSKDGYNRLRLLCDTWNLDYDNIIKQIELKINEQT